MICFLKVNFNQNHFRMRWLYYYIILAFKCQIHNYITYYRFQNSKTPVQYIFYILTNIDSSHSLKNCRVRIKELNEIFFKMTFFT